MPAATSTALERVCSRCLRNELNYFRLPFLDLLTVLRRRKNKARVSLGVDPNREWLDPEAMRMVSRRDLELYSRTLLDANRWRIELVLIRSNFDYSDALRLTRRCIRWPANGAAHERDH